MNRKQAPSLAEVWSLKVIHLHAHYKGTRKDGQVEILENINNSDEIPDGVNAFDEFDSMAPNFSICRKKTEFLPIFTLIFRARDSFSSRERANNPVRTTLTECL